MLKSAKVWSFSWGKGSLVNVLIANSDPGERIFLSELADPLNPQTYAASGDQAMLALRSRPYEIVFVDAALALDPGLRSHLPLAPCVLLTGRKESVLKEAIRSWPFDHFVEYVLISTDPARARSGPEGGPHGRGIRQAQIRRLRAQGVQGCRGEPPPSDLGRDPGPRLGPDGQPRPGTGEAHLRRAELSPVPEAEGRDRGHSPQALFRGRRQQPARHRL